MIEYKKFSKIKKIFFLPSKAGVPIAVGIMSPDARMASNLDIKTDNLKRKDYEIIKEQQFNNDFIQRNIL